MSETDEISGKKFHCNTLTLGGYSILARKITQIEHWSEKVKYNRMFKYSSFKPPIESDHEWTFDEEK